MYTGKVPRPNDNKRLAATRKTDMKNGRLFWCWHEGKHCGSSSLRPIPIAVNGKDLVSQLDYYAGIV